MTQLQTVANRQLSDASQLDQFVTLFQGNYVFDAANGYGALGDNVTDNTTAFQNAINAAAAAGGGMVFVPAATSPYITGQLVLKQGVWLVGASMLGTVLKLKSGANTSFIINHVSTNGTNDANAEGVGVFNLTLDCNKAQQTGTSHGIFFNTNPITTQASSDYTFDTHQTVENVQILNALSDGFNAAGRSEHRLKNVWVRTPGGNGFTPTFNTYMLNCVSDNAGQNGFNITSVPVRLVGCKSFSSGQGGSITTTNGVGYYLSGTGGAATLVSCEAQDNLSSGFILNGAQEVILQACVADSNSRTSAGTYPGVDISSATNNTIDCICMERKSNGATSYQQNALRIGGSSTGNDIRLQFVASNGATLGTPMMTASITINNSITINGATIKDGLYNVKVYGATGNGTTDDTTAVQAAIAAAASASGGTVYIPPGTYQISSTLSITSDNIDIVGDGWSSILRATVNLNADVISTPTTAGSIRQNCSIRNLKIDGTRGSQTAGAAIHLYGTRYCQVDHCWIINAFNYCISLDGDGTGFGFNNRITHCVMDTSNGCVTEQFNEANVLLDNQFKYSDTNQMVVLNSGYNFVTDNVFGAGGNYPGPALQLGNNGPSKIVSNRFDQVRNEAIKCNSGGQIIIGNAIGSPGKATAVPGIHIGANSGNVVMGNKIFDITGHTFSYSISEDGGADHNLILGNSVIAGATGVINVVGVHTQVRDNDGFNPQGVAAIAVGGNPFTYTNNDSVEEYVTVDGGTITTVVKDTITLYSFGGTAARCGVLLKPGEAVTVTYSVAPTMNKDRK